MEVDVRRPDVPNIDGLTEDQIRTLASCRTFPQYVSMIGGYRVAKCPFCDPLDPNLDQVLMEAGTWRIWANPFPLTHTDLHLVMAPKRHVAPGDDIRPEDFVSMGRLFDWARRQYQFDGGGFVMRFGSPTHNAGTVLHLHGNIIIPDQTGVVEVMLAKSPEEIAQQTARMYVFEKLRKGIPLSQLSEQERVLIEGRL